MIKIFKYWFKIDFLEINKELDPKTKIRIGNLYPEFEKYFFKQKWKTIHQIINDFLKKQIENWKIDLLKDDFQIFKYYLLEALYKNNKQLICQITSPILYHYQFSKYVIKFFIKRLDNEVFIDLFLNFLKNISKPEFEIRLYYKPEAFKYFSKIQKINLEYNNILHFFYIDDNFLDNLPNLLSKYSFFIYKKEKLDNDDVSIINNNKLILGYETTMNTKPEIINRIDKIWQFYNMKPINLIKQYYKKIDITKNINLFWLLISLHKIVRPIENLILQLKNEDLLLYLLKVNPFSIYNMYFDVENDQIIDIYTKKKINYPISNFKDLIELKNNYINDICMNEKKVPFNYLSLKDLEKIIDFLYIQG